MKLLVREIAPYIITRLLADGGQYGEVFYEKRYSTLMVFENGVLSKINRGYDEGVGIRLIKDGKTVYGYTTEITKDNLLNLAGTLVSSEGEGKIRVGVAHLSGYNRAVLDPEDFFITQKKGILEKAYTYTVEYDKRISHSKVTLQDSKREIMVVNSFGEIVEDVQPRVSLKVEAIAKHNGDMYVGYETTGSLQGYEFFEESLIKNVAEKAGYRAVAGLNGKKAPVGSMPVVIGGEAGGTMIHEAVGHGLEADLAEKGLSVYSGKIGEKVASHLITVVDDGTLPGKIGSFTFDDEGVPSQKTVLIKDGYLVGFMYDRLTALVTGKKPTGNGRRETYRNEPIVRMRNTYIQKGKDNPEDIIKDTKKGIYVAKMGGGQVNTVNGDFMFEIVEGYLIENGELTYPIRGAALLGNGPKALNCVEAVGNDTGWSIGMCGKNGQLVPVGDGQPTIKLSSLVVGGSG